jgi:hypothetical protein
MRPGPLVVHGRCKVYTANVAEAVEFVKAMGCDTTGPPVQGLPDLVASAALVGGLGADLVAALGEASLAKRVGLCFARTVGVCCRGWSEGHVPLMARLPSSGTLALLRPPWLPFGSIWPGLGLLEACPAVSVCFQCWNSPMSRSRRPVDRSLETAGQSQPASCQFLQCSDLGWWLLPPRVPWQSAGLHLRAVRGWSPHVTGGRGAPSAC